MLTLIFQVQRVREDDAVMEFRDLETRQQSEYQAVLRDFTTRQRDDETIRCVSSDSRHFRRTRKAPAPDE